MVTFNCLFLGLLVMSACLHWAAEANILNMCHAQCRREEQLKAACRRERNCGSLLPDFDALLRCLAPCSRIGTNCFQRCAFKTDEISATCLQRCPVGDAAGTGAVLSPADVSSTGVGTSDMDTERGTLCYKSCYDELLNAAMDRLYTKRPRSG